MAKPFSKRRVLNERIAYQRDTKTTWITECFAGEDPARVCHDLTGSPCPYYPGKGQVCCIDGKSSDQLERILAEMEMEEALRG